MGRTMTIYRRYLDRCRWPRHAFLGLLLSTGIAFAAQSGCSARPAARNLRLDDIQAAPPVPILHRQRMWVTDLRSLVAAYPTLGKRAVLLYARTPAEWSNLRRLLPDVALRPDFDRGAIIGIVSMCGSTITGEWPVAIESVRVLQGAGLLRVELPGGTFLPDGAGAAELAFVECLRTALVVDVNAERYFPETPAPAHDLR